jgi:5-methylcytosine-specific restriction endonuclease McrBC regulatory subunit McrC
MTDDKIKAIFVITFEIGCENREPPMRGKNIEKRNKTHQRLTLEFESLENSFERLAVWLKVQISFMM